MFGLFERLIWLKQRARRNRCRAYVRGERTGDVVFDNIMEECDRANKRSDATIIYYKNDIRNDIIRHK